MKNLLYVDINLQLCLPRDYENDKDIILDLKDIKNNLYEFIYSHKNEFKVKTLFELQDS